MVFIGRLNGLAAAGLLVVVIGLERFVNALLVDGIASYTSVRFVVAIVCVAAGSLLVVLDAFMHLPRRPPRRS